MVVMVQSVHLSTFQVKYGLQDHTGTIEAVYWHRSDFKPFPVVT